MSASSTRRTRGALLRASAAVGLLVMAGCAPAPDAPNEATPTPGRAGTTVHEVSAGGQQRTFRQYRPAQVADPAPLVVVFHGHGGSASGIETSTGWDTWADENGAVVLFPEGVQGSFNAGECCGGAQSDDIDDVGATMAMIDAVADDVPLDTARTYATGFSNGGSMAYRLACETDRFAAIGPVSGAQYVPCESPSSTSVIHVHGTDDMTVPAQGSTRPDGTVVRPLEQVAEQWRSALNCGEPADEQVGGVQRSVASCPDDRTVEILVAQGVPHTWPIASDGLDATAEIGRFFSEHRR